MVQIWAWKLPTSFFLKTAKATPKKKTLYCLIKTRNCCKIRGEYQIGTVISWFNPKTNVPSAATKKHSQQLLTSGLLLLLQLRGVGNMLVKTPNKSTLDCNLALFHQWLSAAKIVWLLLPNSQRVLCSSTRKFLRESHKFQSCCFTHCTPTNFLRQSACCCK